MCKEYVEPIMVGFNNCQFSFTGKKLNPKTRKPENFMEQNWGIAGDHYVRYNPKLVDKFGELKWFSLIFYTKPIDKEAVDNEGVVAVKPKEDVKPKKPKEDVKP